MARARGKLPGWSVYLVRRGDGALYAGIATDPERRLAAHRAGIGAKALRGRGPLALVWSVSVGDRSTAQRIEAQLKRWPKDRKEHLVASRADIASLGLDRPQAGREDPDRGADD